MLTSISLLVALVIKDLIIWESKCNVNYEGAEVHITAIMQISEIMRKQILNGGLAPILDFISAKFVMGYPCARLYILLYIQCSI